MKVFSLFISLLFSFNTYLAQSELAVDTSKTQDTLVLKVEAKDQFYKSPGRAMLLSTILPGAGQYYTENYLKGGLITVAWGTLGYLAIREHRLAQKEPSSSEYHQDRRNNFLWWTAAVWVFSIADAYVSSHMYKFKEQETLSKGVNLELNFPLTVSFKLQKPFWF